ncbi:MAG: threonine--tRNA ligase [Candidatus ainarchaeum sp.]|nr:threonine--tRNA ligase [Candidatus ainarchaeum sp.]
MDVIEKVNFANEKDKEVYWHTTAHILAAAVKRLYPTTTIAIGPAIENGFYYDFDNLNIIEEDLKKIEEEMSKIIKEKLPMKKEVVSKKKALEVFKKEIYKTELINDLPKDEEISLYHLGKEFTDLCRGPHLANTGMIGEVKLLSIAGAYWRGDEKNKMLTRLYGISFPDKKQLRVYLELLEEAKRRDHRKLGKKLDLFVFSELVGPGLPLWTPTGNIFRNEIINFSRELQNAIGYQEVHTPQITKAELFKISGHYNKYKDDMFKVISNYSKDEYFLKPMNCPNHTQIYASLPRSYKDLPIRYADFAMLYRDEKPGELSGLARVRSFSQDDGHCFCTPEQMKEEFLNVLKCINAALKVYGLNYYVRLSLRDENAKEKYLGNDEIWNKSQKALKDLLKSEKISFVEAPGEAAFYGPKMDIMAKDALNREWQISTIQLDMNLPERFELKYTDKDNTEKRPIMIHRALIGSPERFGAVLIEHFAGKFPLWLNPRQILVVPVAENFNKYAQEVCDSLKAYGLRVDIDLREITMNKKIRDGEMLYYNYILVVGEKEASTKSVNARIRDTKTQKTLTTQNFKEKALVEYKKRELKSSL